MQTMPVPMLRRLLETQSESGREDRMIDLIVRSAREVGASVEVDAGNVYAVCGEATAYPCVVAHTDTVHPIVAHDRYAVRFANGEWWASDPTTGEPRGVGGDDKVGIWIAPSAPRELPAVKTAFFHAEEVGRRGSRAARMTFYSDVGFVLQSDRRGTGELVRWFHGLELLYGDPFADAVAPILDEFGYREVPGGSTDVRSRADNGIGIAVANVACGYYRPQTPFERIVHAKTERAADLVLRIWRESGGVRFPARRAASVA